MRKFIPILIVAITSLAGDASAQNDVTPLWTAFKTFCIDTGAKPDAVEAAVVKAGGVLKNRVDTQWPYPMKGAFLEYVIAGDRLSVQTMKSHIPQFISMGDLYGEQCMIGTITNDTNSNDDISVAAIRRWVGIPPVRQMITPDIGSSEGYIYRETETGRIALEPNSEAMHKASAEGQEWVLVILQMHGHAGVQLGHILPAQ
jgi:hypothetical protein